jgi:hypothetical protein
MDKALQTVVLAAAGTGAPTNQNSRYYGYSIRTYTRVDGVQIAYLERRIIPQPEVYTSVRDYVLVEGDRLDNLAATRLGDPILFWMISDANAATDPDELTDQVGKTIKIPVSAAIPPGVRHG